MELLFKFKLFIIGGNVVVVVVVVVVIVVVGSMILPSKGKISSTDIFDLRNGVADLVVKKGEIGLFTAGWGDVGIGMQLLTTGLGVVAVEINVIVGIINEGSGVVVVVVVVGGGTNFGIW